MNKPMDMAIVKARETSKRNEGGAFGATIVNSKTSEIICVASNQVLKNNDPTAHAEIEAIRGACEILGTYDLTGYTIYATGFPCPMCMSAIIWANLDKVIYAGNVVDAEEIGFRDRFIYDYLTAHDMGNLKPEIKQDKEARVEVLKMYDEYKKNGKIY